jgi:hypothetical protein
MKSLLCVRPVLDNGLTLFKPTASTFRLERPCFESYRLTRETPRHVKKYTTPTSGTSKFVPWERVRNKDVLRVEKGILQISCIERAFPVSAARTYEVAFVSVPEDSPQSLSEISGGCAGKVGNVSFRSILRTTLILFFSSSQNFLVQPCPPS